MHPFSFSGFHRAIFMFSNMLHTLLFLHSAKSVLLLTLLFMINISFSLSSLFPLFSFVFPSAHKFALLWTTNSGELLIAQGPPASSYAWIFKVSVISPCWYTFVLHHYFRVRFSSPCTAQLLAIPAYAKNISDRHFSTQLFRIKQNRNKLGSSYMVIRQLLLQLNKTTSKLNNPSPEVCVVILIQSLQLVTSSVFTSLQGYAVNLSSMTQIQIQFQFNKILK